MTPDLAQALSVFTSCSLVVIYPVSVIKKRCYASRLYACLATTPCYCNMQGLRFTLPACRLQDHYLHAEHMYEPWNMKHRKLKWGVACAAVVSAGFVIPSGALYWQKAKAAG